MQKEQKIIMNIDTDSLDEFRSYAWTRKGIGHYTCDRQPAPQKQVDVGKRSDRPISQLVYGSRPLIQTGMPATTKGVFAS